MKVLIEDDLEDGFILGGSLGRVCSVPARTVQRWKRVLAARQEVEREMMVAYNKAEARPFSMKATPIEGGNFTE